MRGAEVVGHGGTVAVQLHPPADAGHAFQVRRGFQPVGLDHTQPRGPGTIGPGQPLGDGDGIAIDHLAAQGQHRQAQQIQRAGGIAIGGVGPAAKVRLYLVAPLAGLLWRPAQEAVVRHGRQAQHCAHHVVAVGLDAAGHQPVIAGQIAGAVREGGQIGQQIRIGAAAVRVPVAQGQIGMRCALVGRHGRPALPQQWLRCAGAALTHLTVLACVATHAYTM